MKGVVIVVANIVTVVLFVMLYVLAHSGIL